jgi:hypothetical protein
MISAWLVRQLPWVIVAGVLLAGAFATVAWLKEQGRKELRPVVERLEQQLESERAARVRNEEALNAYQKELDVVRNRPRPTTPVRMCVTPSVRKATPAAGGVNGAATSAGSDSGQAGEDLVAGPDIGPPLRDLAYGCDVENAKLRALQNWVRSLDK